MTLVSCAPKLIQISMKRRASLHIGQFLSSYQSSQNHLLALALQQDPYALWRGPKLGLSMAPQFQHVSGRVTVQRTKRRGKSGLVSAVEKMVGNPGISAVVRRQELGRPDVSF